jgi:hypothetical protein
MQAAKFREYKSHDFRCNICRIEGVFRFGQGSIVYLEISGGLCSGMVSLSHGMKEGQRKAH